LFGGDPSTFKTQEQPGPRGQVMPWWTIPRSARVAIREMASERNASVSRCLRIDEGGQITYEVHATRRTGLFQRQDFVLTRISESREAAEERQEQRTLSGRLKTLRATIQRESSPQQRGEFQPVDHPFTP
ncbi:MAG TPA: hypothetical protein VFT74_00900, partial [Isosphaeraceae bacterium]|nr:hypothetical protein [Isosphaeraceae bacterium]